MDTIVQLKTKVILSFAVMIWYSNMIPSSAQPSLGTTSFATASNISLVASAPCTAGQSANTSGFLITLYSASNCAITNATGGTSDGHISLITTPTVTGIWQEARIASNTGSEFKLENFVFAALTTPFLSKTLDIVGYLNGSPVSGATASSPIISATGIANTITIDVSANSAFNNIDEFRITPSAPATAQGTIALTSVTISAALPVELVHFKARSSTEGSVFLEWQTISELNNAGFEIQKSDDSETFYTIGYVEGKGNSNDTHYYTYTTKTRRDVYFRLKQVNFDGSNSYSTIIHVDDQESPLSIAPNPVLDRIFLHGNPDLNYTCYLTDLPGSEIVNCNGTIYQIQETLNHHLKELKAGNYQLKLKNNEYWQVLKIIKIQ